MNADPGKANVVIANGQSQSGAFDAHGYRLMALLMPAAWSAADITFLASDSLTGTFLPVYDDAGVEVKLTVAAGRAVGVDAAAGKLAAFRFMKLRSGTASVAVNQGADRAIGVLMEV